MGTHCLIIMRVKENGKYREYCVLYKHWDGYLSEAGLDLLTFLSEIKVTNRFSGKDFQKLNNGELKVAYDAGDLFAQIIAHFKTKPGDTRIVPVGNYDLMEYNYYVDVVLSDAAPATIEITIDDNGEIVVQDSDVQTALEYIKSSDE